MMRWPDAAISFVDSFHLNEYSRKYITAVVVRNLRSAGRIDTRSVDDEVSDLSSGPDSWDSMTTHLCGDEIEDEFKSYDWSGSSETLVHRDSDRSSQDE